MEIRKLAEREHRAEATRKTAEDAWRRTWWATTMALGATTTKPDRAEAVRTVEQITGRSRGYIQSRAKTGEAFQGLTLGAVGLLPPRMSMELAQAKVEITPAVVRDLLQADEDGVSLREFSAKLTGKAWADTAAGASEERIAEILSSQPEKVAEIVAADSELYKAVRDIHFKNTVDRHQREGTSPWDRGEFDQMMVEHRPGMPQHNSLEDLVMATKRIRRMTEHSPLSDKARTNIRWVIAELTAISEGEGFVGELESWLEEVSS